MSLTVKLTFGVDENTDCGTGHVDTDLSQGVTFVVTVGIAYSGLLNRLISSKF